MTPGSVAIDGLVLWHVPSVHHYCLAIDSASAGISLTLALVSAAARSTSTVLKSTTGVTIIGNSGVCHVLVIIARLEVTSPTRSTKRENRTPVGRGVFTYKVGSREQCGGEG